MELTALQRLAVLIIPILFGIILHEVAHGWVAQKYGDNTAKESGRLTLNPLKHIDPIGTILVPALLFYTTGYIFGWAKPVPVNFQNLNNPKRDMAIVAISGPAANLIMMFFWALFGKLGVTFIATYEVLAQLLIFMGIAGIVINCALMILNLIPIPPLDGSRIVTSILPKRIAYQYNQLEPFGFFILLALLLTGVLFKIIFLPILLVIHFVMWVFQIPFGFLLLFFGIKAN